MRISLILAAVSVSIAAQLAVCNLSLAQRQPRQQATPRGQQLEIPPNVAVQRDVVYATPQGHELTLDIAYPKSLKRSVPAIVHIHGGAWRRGQKALRQALRYARLGWVGVSINYRLSGVAKFPAGVRDCKTAIRWLRANAKTYGVDPNRIGVFGSSAGGHLVALLGTSGGDRNLEGTEYAEYSSRVQAVVDHFGPTDFLRMNDTPGAIDHDAEDSPESQWIGGPIRNHVDQVRKANPISYVDRGDPPVLMIHGENDQLVIFSQSELLQTALQEAGVTTQLVKVKNAGHSYRPIPVDATVKPSRQEIQQLEINWFRRHLSAE